MSIEKLLEGEYFADDCIQRFEARLDGISKRDDWEMMCATTPATIQRLHFDRPSSCENRASMSFSEYSCISGANS